MPELPPTPADKEVEVQTTEVASLAQDPGDVDSEVEVCVKVPVDIQGEILADFHSKTYVEAGVASEAEAKVRTEDVHEVFASLLPGTCRSHVKGLEWQTLVASVSERQYTSV